MHIVPVMFCSIPYKGTGIALLEVILHYSTLSGTNGQILTPKRYDKHPCHFYRGVPLPPPPPLRDLQDISTTCKISRLDQKFSETHSLPQTTCHPFNRVQPLNITVPGLVCHSKHMFLVFSSCHINYWSVQK